jgi:hypothetical protein
MIHEIHWPKVMLDRDLVDLYRVELKALNQATKRNIERSPVYFMFQLTRNEWDILWSQIVTANEQSISFLNVFHKILSTPLFLFHFLRHPLFYCTMFHLYNLTHIHLYLKILTNSLAQLFCFRQ